MLCVCFFSIVSLFPMCLVCIFLFLSSINNFNVCYVIIDVLHFTSITTTLNIFVICLPFQIIDVHDSFSLFSSFFVTIMMESSTLNIFINMEVEFNGFCVGYRWLVGYNNNNIMNKLKYEAPFDIGINDPIM